MVRKSWKMREMGGIIPTPQGPVGELLVRVVDMPGRCSNSDLQTVSGAQLAADLKEKIFFIDGVVVHDLERDDFGRGQEAPFKPWQHAASLPPPPASGRGTVPPPAILLGRLPPA